MEPDLLTDRELRLLTIYVKIMHCLWAPFYGMFWRVNAATKKTRQ